MLYGTRFTTAYRFLGMILASLLIVTLFQFFQVKEAFADEGDPGTGTNDPNPPVNPPSWIKLTTANDSDGIHANLKVDTDVDVAPTSSEVKVYKQGVSQPLQTFTSGKGNTYSVTRPSSGVDEYYAKVDSLTSNSVGVSASTWIVNLSISDSTISTNDATPTLTATLDQALPADGSLGLYLVDTTDGNRVLSRTNSGDSRTGSTIRFVTGVAHVYKAYVASWDANAYSINSVSNIRAISNSIAAVRNGWTVNLELDRSSYSTNDPTPNYTITLNQPLYSSAGDNTDYFAVSLFDQTNGSTTNLVARLHGSAYDGQKVFTGTLPRSVVGSPHTYSAYVSRYDSSAYYSNSLPDLQATSPSISTARNGWTADLAVDKVTYGTDDEAPKYTITLNQPLYSASGDTSSAYTLYLFDTSSTACSTQLLQVAGAASSDKLVFTGSLPRYYTGAPHTYQAFVARGGGTYCNQLDDVQASTQTVAPAPKAWTASLSMDKYLFAVDDATPKYTVTLNQPLNDSETDAAGGGWSIYVWDKTDQSVAAQINASASTDGKKTFTGSIPRYVISGSNQYVAYVARTDTGVSVSNPPREIQAESATLTVARKNWSVSLATSITQTTATSKTVKVTATMNQPIYSQYGGTRYALWIFDQTAGGYVEDFDGVNYSDMFSISKTFTEPLGEDHVYIAYIARTYGGYMLEGSMTEIQAVSNRAMSGQSVSGPTYPGEMAGGSNPNEGPCRGCHADPIDSYTGSFFENDEDLSIPSVIPFQFTRSYSSENASKSGGLGYGWTSNYDMKVALVASETPSTTLKAAQQLTVSAENGSLVAFSKVGSSYVAPTRVLANLRYEADGDKFIFTRNNGFRFQYDATSGLLEKVQDRNGNSLSLTYQGGQLKKVTSSDGKYLLLERNSQDRIISMEDNAGRSVTYGYDGDGNLTSASSASALYPTKYGYDTSHQITSVGLPTDAANVYDTTTNTYSAGRVTKQTRPDGKYFAFAYAQAPSTQGQITTITNPDGSVTRDEYSFLGQLVKQTRAYGTSDAAVTSYQYGATGQLTQVVDPEKHITNMTYDAAGNLLMVIDPLGRPTSFTYNNFNQLLTTTNAMNNAATNEYDGDGNLIKSKDFEGNTTKYEFNSDGTVKNTESPNAVEKNTSNPKSTFAYDVNNFLHTSTDARGGVTTYNMNDLNQPEKITDDLGHYTQYEYDGLNRPSKTIAADGATTQTGYDEAGRISWAKDELQRQSNYEYDSLNNVKSISNSTANSKVAYTYDEMNRVKNEKYTAASGAPTWKELSYTYDKRGNVLTATNGNGKVSSYTYYLNDLVKAIHAPSGILTTYSYDAIGNVTQVSIAAADGSRSIVSNATYDALNRLLVATNSDGVKVGYGYDKNGRVTKTTRNDNSELSTEYDADGNVTKSVAADQTHQDYVYDAADNLISQKDEAGNETTYAYNSLNQNVSTLRPDGSTAKYSYTDVGQLKATSYDNWATKDVEYFYGVDGQPSQEIKGGVTTAYAYDVNGNVTYRGPPVVGGDFSHGVQYGYDAWQQQDNVTYPSGVSLTYGYDKDGNRTSVQRGNDTLLTYTLNNDDQPTQAAYGNGTVQTYGYDKLGRLNNLQIKNAAGDNLWSKSLTLSNSGLIQNQTTVEGDGGSDSGYTVTKNYAYDALNRLSSTDRGNDWTNNYSYDDRGNLTGNLQSPQSPQTYNSLGQVVKQQPVPVIAATFSYDNRGNRVSRSDDFVNPDDPEDVRHLGGISYGWDDSNHLTSVSSPYATYSYTYDASGLVATKASAISSSTAPPTVENYVWDESASTPALLEDDSNSYLYGDSYVPFAQIDKTSGDLIYLYQDDLGTVILAAKSDGEQIDGYGHGLEYGANSDWNGMGDYKLPFGFAGQYFDSSTQLYNMRARWYDPNTGNFMSKDPAAASTGEAYSYASGNPVSMSDPLGLWSIGDVVAGAANFAGDITGVKATIAAAQQINWGEVAQFGLGLADGLSGGLSTMALDAWAPGAINHCSTAFAWGSGIGTVASFFIPGGNVLHTIGLVAHVAGTAIGVAKVAAVGAKLGAVVGIGSKLRRAELSQEAIRTELRALPRWINQFGKETPNIGAVAGPKQVTKLYKRYTRGNGKPFIEDADPDKFVATFQRHDGLRVTLRKDSSAGGDTLEVMFPLSDTKWEKRQAVHNLERGSIYR